MKPLYAIAAVALIASPVYAQQGSTTSSHPADASSQNQKAMADKIKADLQNAGFKNVNVVAQSFAVTAKSKDGSDVYMTFGPSGMSLIESVGTVNNNTSSGVDHSQSKK